MAIETEQQEDDSIRGLLEKAAAGDIQAESPVNPPELSAEAPTEAAPPVERADRGDGRDATGKFVGKPKDEPAQSRETLTLKPKEQAQTQAQAKPGEQAAKPADQDPPPPAEFLGQGKVDWNRLPSGVKAELKRGWESLQAERAEVAPIKELIDTNRQFLVNEAGSLPEAFRQLIYFAQMANGVDTAPQLALHILQRKGIDPRSVFSGQPTPQVGNQQQAPNWEAIIDQRVQQRLQPIVAQVEQRENQQHLSTIESFAADPAHPYFNDVRQAMGILLKNGQASNLQDAYDQATWANPSIRQALMAQQAGDAAKAKAAEVEAARKAALLSPSGAPTHGNSSVVGQSDGSIRGDLMAAWAAQRGAV